MQFERWAHHDHRATRVVHALAKKVLAEAALFALDHVRQGLQRPAVAAGDHAAAAAVVEQRVHGFLQHALLVAHDDVRSAQIEQPLEAVVAVDDATVEIVQVRGGETSAFEGHQRAQVRWQHRQHGHDHALRLVAGGLERLHELETFGQLLDLRLGGGLRNLFAQFLHLAFDVEVREQIAHGLRAHAGDEFGAVLLNLRQILLFGQQLALLEIGEARVHHHIGLEIEHALDGAQRADEALFLKVLERVSGVRNACALHRPILVQQQTDARRQRFQEPDVRHRACQLDVAHALAAHLGETHLHAALLANHAAVLQALVFAAKALVILHRAEDASAEQAVPLRLLRPIVDRFGLADLSVRPRPHHLRRGEADLQGVELLVHAFRCAHEIEQTFHVAPFRFLQSLRSATPLPATTSCRALPAAGHPSGTIRPTTPISGG